jgi:hypothetical protein
MKLNQNHLCLSLIRYKYIPETLELQVASLLGFCSEPLQIKLCSANNELNSLTERVFIL